MSGFFTLQALIMFALGVLLSAMVKGFVGMARSKVSGG